MKKQGGYIAILTVLMLSAIGIVIATTVTLLSIGESQSALSLTKGEGGLNFVEGCVDDALLKSQQNNSYNGGAITRPEGTCSITMVSKVGSTWTMTTTTTDTKFKRTIQIIFTRPTSGNITISSWKEI